MPVIAMVRLTAAMGRRDELLQALQDAVELTRSQEHCHQVNLLGGVENADDVLLEETWRSVEDHQQFIGGVIESGGLDAIMPLLAGEIETLHYTQLDPV